MAKILKLFITLLSVLSVVSGNWTLATDRVLNPGSKIRSSLLELDLSLAYCNKINLREITVTELQNALISKQITSVQLVQCYIRRIRAMDPYLHSVLEINPDAQKIAIELDGKRALGVFLGPMHGIPIIVKDNIATGDRMETTAGSVALLGIKPKEDSGVVKLLRSSGAIILGKANLDEFASGRSNTSPDGWSGRGGRTSNAYVLSRSSRGSSSGSAVAVAANLVSVSLGTETRSSIVWPSGVAAVVGLKTTLGRVSTNGVIPLVTHQDVVGPITRTVSDAAIVFSIISKDGFREPCFSNTTVLEKCTNRKFKVGVLRDPDWSPQEYQEAATHMPRLNEILKTLGLMGITVIDPVVEAPGTRTLVATSSAVLVDNHAFKAGVNDYLGTKVRNNIVLAQGGLKRIRNMEDIIEYNKQHPEEYDQQGLIDSLSTDGIKNTTFIAEQMRNYKGAQVYLNYIFRKYGLDALVFPTSNDVTMQAVAGFPYINVPAGFDANKVPFGISFIGLPNTDEKLLILGYIVERYLKVRKPSEFLP